MLALRPGSTRALAQGFVERGVREGLSGNRIGAALKQAGLGYRRQDFLRDVAHYAGRAQNTATLRNVRFDRMPTEGIMSEARRYQSNRYLYTVEIRTRDGEESLYRQVSSSKRLTRQEAIDEATAPSRGYGGWESEDAIKSADLYAIDLDVRRSARAS